MTRPVSTISHGGCLKSVNKKIAFRVDASAQIGTGHFMRCLTLADALKKRGAHIRFVCRHLPGHFQDTLAAKGHGFILLDGCPNEGGADELAHAQWLGTSQHADAQDSVRALADQSWDWLIVDHYALDARWESVLRQAANNILVIDDIADRRHDCDVLLDQNFYADRSTRYTGKVPEHCRLLLGPGYALLRDEFRELHEHAKPRAGLVKRVLVFFGGVDADNYTNCAINALADCKPRDLNVDVVIGAQHPYREQVESACAKHSFSCHVQTSRMPELMAAADLAIGAGGSAAWERCCVGLPTFAVCTAVNQVRQVADAAAEGLMYAPELTGELRHAIKYHLRALLENSCLRQAISHHAFQAVDGRGVLRVMGSMGCSDIEIRVVGTEDSRQLFEWRNHPAIRAVSRNPDEIEWDDHQKWVDAVLASSDRFLLIGQRAGKPVGVVRFDIRHDEAEVSLYLVPGIKEAGLGRELLQSAEHWLAVNSPGVCKVRAHVLGGNERSHRLFLGSGYQVESSLYAKVLQ